MLPLRVTVKTKLLGAAVAFVGLGVADGEERRDGPGGGGAHDRAVEDRADALPVEDVGDRRVGQVDDEGFGAFDGRVGVDGDGDGLRRLAGDERDRVALREVVGRLDGGAVGGREGDGGGDVLAAERLMVNVAVTGTLLPSVTVTSLTEICGGGPTTVTHWENSDVSLNLMGSRNAFNSVAVALTR